MIKKYTNKHTTKINYRQAQQLKGKCAGNPNYYTTVTLSKN